jgi:ethanolamine utilization protein EutN
VFLAEVVGNVVATLKDSGLDSRRMLVIQPVTSSGAPSGEPLVAVDGVGVGVGERVLYVRGREASFVFLPDVVPADVSIVGKVDQVNLRRQPEPSQPRRRSRS